MRYDPEAIAKYLWVALIAVVIVVVVVVVFPPSETRSSCTGFQYFVFLSQKMTPDSYSIELLNGPRDIVVKGFNVDGRDVGAAEADVKAGDSFIIRSLRDPTNAKVDENFRYHVIVSYDMNGIKENRDSATCTGKIQ